MSSNTNQAAQSALAKILHDASGFDLNELDHRASFFEIGFDSLFLVQFTQKIKSQLKVKITFRQLIEEILTLSALIEFVARNAPALVLSGTSPAPAQPELVPADEPVRPPQPRPVPATFVQPPVQAGQQPVATEVSPADLDRSAYSSDTPVSFAPISAMPLGGNLAGLEQIIAQQNQLMSLQLQLLSGAPVASQPIAVQSAVAQAAPTLANSNPPTSPALDSNALDSRVPVLPTLAIEGPPQKQKFERFGPYKPVRKSPSGGLTETQQQSLDQLVERFTKRTIKSREHAQKHRPHFADPRGVAGYRRIWKSIVYQISVERSAGCKLWDVDGNEYIDIAMGFGLNLFGQSPEFVTTALHKQLDLGVEVGPQSPLAGEVAQLLCDFSRKERVTFCNTGSEAVMAAMRLARTVTGKTKIVFFNRDYHGNFDEVLLRSNQIGQQRKTQPAAPGVPQSFAENAIVLVYGTQEALDTIRQRADEIAAVLVEPVQSADPFTQPREFLHEVRKITNDHDIALIMDEVITGFRAAQGGAQEWFDVWGDMATYGKVLGGGLPIGALAGSAKYMDALDGGTWRYEDASEPTADMTFFAGTFVRHPLAMAAAHQILMKLKEEGPELQENLTGKTTKLVKELNQFFDKELFPFRVAQFTSLFRFMFPSDLEYADLLYFHLLDRGIFTRGWGDNCFLSTAHTDQDIQRIINAVKSSCLEIRDGGFMPKAEQAPAAGQLRLSTVHQTEERVACLPHPNGLIAKQAAKIRVDCPTRVSTLEEIQEGGDLPPLFCMPAADGLTLVYHHLAEHLGDNLPVYGLTSPGVYGEAIPPTVEEVSQRFIEDIREFRPHGPYLLIGYCSGGTIAFEVAQQLIAAGEQVALVAGIETYDWGTAQSSRLTPAIKGYYYIQRIEFHFRNFWLLGSRDKWAFLKSKMNRAKARSRNWRGMLAGIFSRQKAVSANGTVNMHELWRLHDAQVERYRPIELPGKLLLIRPRKDYRCYVGKEDLRARDGVRIVRIPAFPAGLMTPPYVEQVATEIRQAIREGLRYAGSTPAITNAIPPRSSVAVESPDQLAPTLSANRM